MIVTETKLKGAFLIDIEKLEDDRGFFARMWCEREMAEYGINFRMVQTNISLNRKKGTLRGMHFQKRPYEEAKLIHCVKGAIYDVIVDLRPESPTFRQWVGFELADKDYRTVFIPGGFAHGFVTLENNTEIIYMMSEFFTPEYNTGFRWNDPAFNIQWPFEISVISDKDKSFPDFEESFL